MAKRTPVSGGKHFATVDNVDYEFLTTQYNNWWYCNGYAATKSQVNGVRRVLLMHREVAKRAGLDMSNTIDHRNRSKLDKRRRNLRPATRGEQQFNRSCWKSRKTKGVYWDSSRKKWRVTIGHLGKRKFIGRFDKKSDAIKAYEKVARELHGEFYYGNQDLSRVQ